MLIRHGGGVRRTKSVEEMSRGARRRGRGPNTNRIEEEVSTIWGEKR